MSRPALRASLTIFFSCVSLAGAQSAVHPTATPAPTVSPSPSPATGDPLDALSEADLQKALAFVKKNYLKPAALDPAGLDRATLAGLIERLGRGVALLSAESPSPSPSPAPLYREILAGHIGYVRPGALRKSDLVDFDNALHFFANQHVDALILDLRATAETEDYALAAEFAMRFTTKGETLFTLAGAAEKTTVFTADRAPSYTGIITVLIDEETTGAPEVLASVLHARERAILIGEPTAGAAVNYSDLALPGGMTLRVAVEEAQLAGQRIGFPHGVQPDLLVPMPLVAKREIFVASLTKGMSPFVFQNDIPHLNEAALLAGTNPEIEAIQQAQQRRARGEKPLPHDPVVQRAVDVITSIAFFRQAPTAPSPASHSP